MPCWTRLLAYAPALWLVWYAHMAEAACPAGVSAPSVTTIMASPTDPEMTALEVTPDCQVTTYSVKPGEGDNSSLLMINKSPARRVASLPTAAQVVFVTSSMVDDVEGLVVPKAVKTLYMFGNQLTSVKNIRLQSGLENLGLSKNQLQSIDFDIPDTLQILNLEGNAFRSIRGVKFPNSLSTIFLESNGISSIEGVRWPASLKTLELTGNTVTNFEVQKSDMSFLPDVTVSTVKPSPIRQRSCTDPTAELVSAFGSNLCVISDQRFKLKYDTSVGVSGASSGSNADKADGSTDASPSPSTTKSPASASASPSSSSQDTDSSQHTSDASMTAGSGSMFPATKIASGSRSAPADVINTPSANKNGSENAIDGTRGTPSTIVTSTRSDSLVMILAVVVGVIVVVIAAIVYWICRRRKRPQNMKEGGGSYDTYTATETPSASQSQSQSQSQDQDRDHFGDSNTSTHAAFIDHDIRNDKVIMKYRIDKSAILVGKLIARGGYGAIYKGQYDNRDVAIKQMLPGTWHNDAMLSSFMAEIRMCARLDHPKIVSFLGVAWSSLQDLSVIIEYMPGGDLHALLHKQPVPTATRTATRTAAGTGAEAAQTGSEASVGTGPRSQDWTQPWTPHNIKPKTAIAMDIAEAVVYLHSFSSPILHRDLKTRNVLLDRHGNAKLSDFGISRELTLDETMTSEIGTAAWIAPEVLRGERYGEKADIYSLGVVLVELDRCRHPYADEKVLRGESTMAESTATGMAGASGSSRGSGRGSNGGGGGGRQSMSHVAHKNTQIAVLVSTGKLRPSVSACCPETVSSLVSRCLAFDADARPTAMEVYYELRQELKKSLPSFSAT